LSNFHQAAVSGHQGGGNETPKLFFRQKLRFLSNQTEKIDILKIMKFFVLLLAIGNAEKFIRQRWKAILERMNPENITED